MSICVLAFTRVMSFVVFWAWENGNSMSGAMMLHWQITWKVAVLQGKWKLKISGIFLCYDSLADDSYILVILVCGRGIFWERKYIFFIIFYVKKETDIIWFGNKCQKIKYQWLLCRRTNWFQDNGKCFKWKFCSS